MPERYAITPGELILLHRCLSSRICLRIFRALQEKGVLNITAIARWAGCNNRDALSHLADLAELVIVHERFYSRRRTFTLQRNRFTELMKKTVDAMDASQTGGAR
jgi:predicted transcriptional regulator